MRSLVEFNDLTSLEEKIKALPGRAEIAINQGLHTDAIEIYTKEMSYLYPFQILLISGTLKKVIGQQVRGII
ncbi:hypothetical protein [Lysinibacillus sp. NPDC056232]|uniref:hypothetical protein n=1 Tax=Lysinibacillus sp. NPDC056232 TaxID=3345756 RepID=UPI0035DB4270